MASAEVVGDTAKPPAVMWISNMELFNKLQFGSNMMLVDLQSAACYERYHVRSAFNIDWNKALKLAEEDEDMGTPAAILKYVSEVHDRRFRLRPYCQVVAYAGGTKYAESDGAVSACSEADGDDDSMEELSSREMVMSFADCLIAEKRITKDVLLVEGGIEMILDVRPYLVKGTDSFYDVQFPTEVVEDFMYLGNFGVANNRKCLDVLGVTHVVNATNACPCPFDDELKYLQCDVEDDLKSDIQQYFDVVLAFVENALENERNRVLIHCQMGMSRSAALVILYLMKSRRLSLRRAYDLVKTARPFVNPNPSFLKQLATYEKTLLGTNSIRFPEGEELTLATIFEWLADDGKTWEKRVVRVTAAQ